MKMITFTIIDRLSGWTYTVIGLQGIPKTDDQSEPETETESQQRSKDTGKEIYYIQGKVKEISL